MQAANAVAERGTGVSDLKDFVLEKNGCLYFSSGDGCVRIDNNRCCLSGNMAFNLPGVQMEFGFPEKR